MSTQPRYTQKQLVDALTQARGIKAAAARALHCTRWTINRYIQRYPAVRIAYDDALQSSIDLAYSKLVDLVEQGDWSAIRFLLTTLGRDRGFTERFEMATLSAVYEERCDQFDADLARVWGDGSD